uniref:BZIP domain-containing protein n=1 Tax=Eptatretus burgeri TaxID=7764 RepID=A0A8C4QQV6_EPTBU
MARTLSSPWGDWASRGGVYQQEGLFKEVDQGKLMPEVRGSECDASEHNMNADWLDIALGQLGDLEELQDLQDLGHLDDYGELENLELENLGKELPLLWESAQCGDCVGELIDDGEWVEANTWSGCWIRVKEENGSWGIVEQSGCEVLQECKPLEASEQRDCKKAVAGKTTAHNPSTNSQELSTRAWRRERKREQNQRAALRYRERRQKEREELRRILRCEEQRREELREKRRELEKELGYLNCLFAELRRSEEGCLKKRKV